MADKEEVLPQGLVFDETGAVRPITREEAEHGLHAPAPKPEKPEEPPAAPADAVKPDDKLRPAGQR